MATAQTLSYIDTEKVLATWAANGGPSDEEVIAFSDAALEQLSQDDMVAQFQENVKQVATAANQIDASFDRVTRKFGDMVSTYGADFPGLSGYFDTWKSYKARWVQYLGQSRDVASAHVVILRRFDQIFLDMVESIESDQDRKDVILELQQFIDEDHQDSVTMSQNFLNLKRDIIHWRDLFDQYLEDQGTKLKEEAETLKLQIDSLQGEIDVLDKKIKDTTIALAATSSCLCLIGMIVSGSVLASYQKQRNDKAEQLRAKQAALDDVNRKQAALANLRSDFDGVKPDIALICEKLSLFAEIWSSVRSQSVQFQEHLKGGMDALTNMRFKKEVRLARAVCQPLQAGLEKYATELENRK